VATYGSITYCAVASAVLTANGLVNGNPAFLTPTHSRSLNQICHRWLCPRLLHCAKFGESKAMGGFWANRWNITQNFYLYLF